MKIPQLKKTAKVKPVNLKQIISILMDKFVDLQAVYVYGSYATGHFSEESDLDLAIKVEGKLDNLSRWKVQQELAVLIGRDTDLLDLGRTSIVMQFEVISKGRQLYCADRDAVSCYEMLVYSQYLDFNLIRKPIIKAIQDRGTIYGGG